MTHSIQRIHTPDAFLVTLDADFDLVQNTPQYFEALYRLYDQETEHILSIVDFKNVSLDFTQLATAIPVLADVKRNPARHRLSSGVIIVTDNKLLRASTKLFRRFDIMRESHLVLTLDDAFSLLDQFTYA